jgi:hypothetical protein
MSAGRLRCCATEGFRVVRARWGFVTVLLAVACRVEGASIAVNAPVGFAGEEVEVAVRLDTGGDEVSATLTELAFDPAVPIAQNDSGDPDCDSALGSGSVLSGFSYRPGSCTPGVDCEGVRGAVLLFDGTLPDGILFSCRVVIPAATPADTVFPLEVVEGTVSDPDGIDIDVTEESRDGGVFVVDEPLCVGDCDGDGSVKVWELVRGIDRAFGRGSDCAFSDRQGDGSVDLSELTAAVGNSLDNCPTREMRAAGREVVALPAPEAQ